MTIEQRNQWRGVESIPIPLTSVRPQRPQGNTGYDEQLDDDSLYPTRQPSSAKRYQTNGVPPPQQHVVTRPRQQAIRRPDQYDNVNVYIRRRSAQALRPQQVPRPGHTHKDKHYASSKHHLTRHRDQDASQNQSKTRRQKPSRYVPTANAHIRPVFIGCGISVSA